ncbi:hypothetical protein M2451_001398 [Dysgonomonas sp. PFB1-18]|uniref:hypothetical protein n=1 Tax=unclassified Dysgonomonas TaxID=2630389 RepID=UPI002476A7D9|nr:MULTISPECIES: hypothetical protein [unclassified Dysgonomonas]MDH6308832.1 hypothetical protein [Dysgonomonas sp. PF1-14]MDH6338472.1 hypothetical protein [Dysgonomonas sp. PF1-16]MDH6380081.1 hypothetical protein [Dysgonomonas sp. PFB1-18]MDH6397300.1 hypothetical protein [Dysgonomonas sp. PF1-23]
MKNYTLCFTVIFLMVTIGLHAQSAAMQAQRHTMQFHQQAMQAHRQAMQSHQMFMNMHIMRSNNMMVRKTNGKYKFNIITLDGDTIVASKKVKINFLEPLAKLTIKTKEGERSFAPHETKEIFIKQKSNYVKGILRDSIWIFNTFSTSEVKFYGLAPVKELGYLNWFQAEGDSVRVITKENMQQLMKGYEKAEKALDKGKTGHAIYYYIREDNKRNKDKEQKKH